MVLTSALALYIFTALTWLESARGGERSLVEVFRNVEDAEAWCVQQLEAGGLRVPPKQ